MARHAAAGRQGLAQGVFQVGGHAGYAVGPLLAAAVVVPRGQASLSWFSGVALVAMVLMSWTATRYAALRREQAASVEVSTKASGGKLPITYIMLAMTVLIVLLFSKNAYTAGFTSYYTFYLIERFHVTIQVSQLMLFLYLVVGAIGVIVGGMVGDRIGRNRVIWISILGSLPFALILPYVDLFWTGVLSILISLIMASAFSSILIYAIDLFRTGRTGRRAVLRAGFRLGRACRSWARRGRRPIGIMRWFACVRGCRLSDFSPSCCRGGHGLPEAKLTPKAPAS
jgi:FSR family fosmidomycin resistance protein-like MFS transporter